MARFAYLLQCSGDFPSQLFVPNFNFRFKSAAKWLKTKCTEKMMEDELSRWIQETVFISYMEECEIFNKLDNYFGLDFTAWQDFCSEVCKTRKRKHEERVADSTDSAGKQPKGTA